MVARPKPFATRRDLATRWRPLAPSEEARATALLADASALIRARMPSIDTRLMTGHLDPDLPRMVACAVVKRAMLADSDQAPVTQVSENWAGFAHQETYANPSGDLYLSGSDIKALRQPQRVGVVNVMPNPGRPRQ